MTVRRLAFVCNMILGAGRTPLGVGALPVLPRRPPRGVSELTMTSTRGSVLLAFCGVMAVAPGQSGKTFSMSDSTLLFGNYNELRLASRSGELVIAPPANVGYNRGYFVNPSISPRGDLVAWGSAKEWDSTRKTRRARFSLGLYTVAQRAWRTFGEFDDIGDAAFSPRGAKVAVVVSRNGKKSLQIFDVENETFVEGPYHRGMPISASLTWAPDGSRLAAEIQRGRDSPVVISIDLATGKQQVLAQGFNPRWSPDGAWLAYYGASAKECMLVRPNGDGGKTIASLRGSDRFGWGSPVWSPDSSRLLANITKDDSPLLDVVEVDLTTGRQTTKLRNSLPVFAWILSRS
jgi:WD40-like Beta Propeller Repeat